MKKRSLFVKLLSVVLSLAMVCGIAPTMLAKAVNDNIQVAVFSDIHYLADNLYDVNSPAWAQYVKNNHRQMEQANALIANALELADTYLAEAEAAGSAFVLIPGDLSKDGEYESHKALAAKFADFESRTGIPVYVINGNHDINNSNGRNYSGNQSTPAQKTTPQDFETLYKDFGYDSADENFISRFKPASGKMGGYLSYSCKLTDGFMLLAIDSAEYSPDQSAAGNEHVTDGMVGEDLRGWIREQCEYAESHNMKVIAMQHHNLVQHMDIEEATFAAFVADDWEELCDFYADNGIHYVFTGHLHAQDTASYVSDSGETVTDVMTCTLTGFPNSMRIVDFTADNTGFTMSTQSHDIDEIRPVSCEVNGETVTYDVPYKYSFSFSATFGDDLKDFAYTAVQGLVDDYFPKIQKAGGLVAFLKESNVDLEAIIRNAIGTNGLAVGDTEILTVSQNVMGFINELGGQIDEKYINDPAYVMNLLDTLLTKLLAFEVSDLPAVKFRDATGIGSSGPTDIDTFAQYALLSFYDGDEDISTDPVFQDVLDGFESGELTEKLFALLREVLVNDLVENEILGSLDFNPGALFPKGTLLSIVGTILQKTVEVLLGGDNSFLNLVSSVLGIPLVPEAYSSVDNILDTLLLDEYLTDSQFKGWGHTISWMIGTLVKDDNPAQKADNTYTVTYTGPVEPEVTVENYRLPSHVAVTLSEDASTGACVSWLTKYSVTGTDIQIVPYSTNPDFSGGSTVSFKAEKETRTESVTYPGADLGFFGLLDFAKDYTRHTVTVSGLEPGTKYSYRIGDAGRDWWSDDAVLETASGSGKFTFLHVSDMQSENETQYGAFNSVLQAAADTAPDAKFIVSSGDQVDLGTNGRQWRYFFNVNRGFLMNTYFMPTTGNHEKSGAAVTNNFVLPNVAEGQNLDTGVYYSYDYNNCHFSVLNTNDDEGDELSSEQVEWLKADVAASDAKWKIVVLHKALYSNGSHFDDAEVKGFRKQLSALLPYLGVDMVLQGHDHVYLRTDAMNGNFTVPSKTKVIGYNGSSYTAKVNPKGTIYSIPGTAGVKIYNTKDNAATDKLFPRAEAIVNADAPMFTAITVDGDRLFYDSYKVVDGAAQKADSFAIEKTDDTAPSEGKLGGFLGKLLSLIDFPFLYRLVAFIGKVVTAVCSLIHK